MKIAIALLLSLALSGCESLTTGRYSILADNNQAIKALNVTGISVGQFTPPKSWDSSCRLAGPLQVADNLTHTEYIKKAFEEELKLAGSYAQGQPRITLSGQVTRMEVSSTPGSWTVDLSLTSSNGSRMAVSEHYQFPSGFDAALACRAVADAYARVVQNIVGKTVRSIEFAKLVK